VDDVLRFDKVGFSYGDHKVLEGVDLGFRQGDFTALIGHNGAGKSTLMKLALGLLRPTEGEVRLFSRSSRDFRDWGKVGYVQQSLMDFDFQFPATVMEVALMGRLSRKRGILKGFSQEDHERTLEALRLVGMEGFKDRKIGALSGGQRQKALLAKTLACQAQILFLDEPTAAMDYNSQHGFYDLLQRLNKELGITIILITHDIGQVLQHVERVVVLNRKVVFEGKTGSFDKKMILDITGMV